MIQQHVLIRLYEELNDYLPERQRKTDFPVEPWDGMNVESLLERMKVEPGRVDLVLVNSVPAGFSTPLSAGDRVAVYPVFERFDIASATLLPNRPLRRPAFAVDIHLGKLAKYLRMAGFDAFYQNSMTTGDLVRLALSQNRIFVTTERRRLKEKEITHLLRVPTAPPLRQLAMITEQLQLETCIRPFSRCLVCNQALEPAGPDQMADSLPAHLISQGAKVFQCPSCSRIYWKGSHFKRMKQILKSVLRPLIHHKAAHADVEQKTHRDCQG